MSAFSPFVHSYPCTTPSPIFGGVSKHRVGVGGIIKPGPAVLVGWVLHNSGYGDATILFYDQVNVPSNDDVADWPLVVEPGRTEVAEFALQIPFFAGLTYRVEGNLQGVLLYS
jgi:hypothetical protein